MSTAEKIAAFLVTAKLHNGITPDIAAHLGVTVNVLRRQMTSEKTSVGALLKAERRRRVQEVLQANPKINAKRMSGICGYPNVEQFYRAFRVCFGCKWTQYQQAAHQ